MWLSPRVVLIWSLALVLVLPACGYRFSSQAPQVLPEGMRTLALTKVDNPTLETWLNKVLRDNIHDEVAIRGSLAWADSSRADALLEVDILRFITGSRIRNSRDQTLKHDVELVIEARLYRSDDHILIWESGPITATNTFVQDNEDDALEYVVLLAAQKLADQLGHSF